ncbi:acyl-CoA dehydrogenase family protein, partial [Wenyingzhuangia sp. 1_MG-2023]|nr:acyl-CoA dehydrogenase family protein [Wenyingzhuangia sp. 1_MG-2023]
REGDEKGASIDAQGVHQTPGFKEAYAQMTEGGWLSLNAPEEFGGQGLPESLGIVISELVGSSNWSWGMYPGLSHGAMNTIEQHGTDAQKATYLT